MKFNLSRNDAFNVIDAWRNSADGNSPISEIQNRIIDTCIENYQKGDYEAVPGFDLKEFGEDEQMEIAVLLSCWYFIMGNEDHLVLSNVFQSIHNHSGKMGFVLSPVLEDALRILAGEGKD